MRTSVYLLAMLLLAFLPFVGHAANLDDTTSTYYLTEGVSPSGLALTQGLQSTVKGWQPTRTLADKPLTWYTAPLTGDIAGGKWAMNLWFARLKSDATLKAEVLVTDAKGGNETVLGTSTTTLKVDKHHNVLYTVNVTVGPTTLKDQLLALRLTKTGGDDLVIGFNANDYDSNFVIKGTIPPPPATGDKVMTFTFRNCTNKYTDDQICYNMDGNNPNGWVPLSKGLVFNAGTRGSARMYIDLGGKPRNLDDKTVPQDFFEYNLNTGGMYVNTTQVDALVIPFTIELVDASGRSQKVGFSESMSNMLDEFIKETPDGFHSCVRDGEIYQAKDQPGVSQLGSPQGCAAMNRNSSSQNPDTYYLQPPCNYYSKFMHDHSISGYAYGFSYDDWNAQSSFIQANNPRPLDMIVSIYWADAPGTTYVRPNVTPPVMPATTPVTTPATTPATASATPDMSTWVVTAITGDNPDNVVNGSGERWTTGRAMQPDDWLEVDMLKAYKLKSVTLDSSQSADDAAHGVQLLLSMDGMKFDKVAELSADDCAKLNGLVQFTLPAGAAGRYIKFVQTGSNGPSWWSVIGVKVDVVAP